ncbi:glycosyltransferase [Sphingobacterium alkalisoli]|uniref:Glycosyltransferase n=1 Tax=Sphingobacterium alkalisoli TaxID=1874115 RepID=A0A4U0GZN9_9SPHI|nr:glycosyltransferase family 2 protein [Sphingobacterium alkalisoli]TJY64224.1 glycosyltransferase [Sphingobacterium alkalisoli]GGH23078.1 glycosyl transferase family 2 [Sphingobacterium alkalisoli]
MKKIPTISLIVSTYNWPEALEKCIQSILKQTQLPNEILIADDGSEDATQEIIERLKQESLIPIVHVWHPDNGFRLSAIRNKAISQARYDYIIQIDGDIIIDRNFVVDHLALSQKKAFLCGSRVLLSEAYSAQLLSQPIVENLNKLNFPLGSILNSLRIPFLSELMADRYKKNQPRALRGCNMSFWKNDLIEINGYNESIQGWGSEDAELAIRLINNGIKKRFLKFGAIAYHIFHKENSKSNLQENEIVFRHAVENQTTWITQGIKS